MNPPYLGTIKTDTTMAKKLLSFNQRPEDECEEILALLDEASIPHYQTPGGLMGLSSPAVWLQNPDDEAQARQLLEGYAQERQHRVRAEYEAMKARGEAPTLWQSALSNPFQFITYIAVIMLIIYLMAWPFW